MKKLSDILLEAQTVVEEIGENSNTIVPPVTAMSADRVGAALEKLDQIGEMANDLYNTLSHLEEIDAETDAALTGAYNCIDDVYAKIDDKYDVIPVDLDEYDLEEEYSELDEATGSIYDPVARHDSNPIPKKLKALGFTSAPVGNSTWKPSGVRVVSLYGLAMRAGKWADIFYAITDDKKPYTVINDGEVQKFSSEGDAIRSITKDVNEDFELHEALSPDAPASEWITDFIKSDAPQFKGKSKKERIKMALGAYYGAQKNEGVELDEAVNKEKIREKINSLKKLYQEFLDKKKDKNYTDEYDAQARIYHDRRLKEIPAELKKLRTKLLGEDVELEESANIPKIKELVSLALIDEKDVAPTIAALKATKTDKTLTPAQTKLLGNLAVMLANVILGDTSALSSVKRAAKE
jgi:hypothetical protein